MRKTSKTQLRDLENRPDLIPDLIPLDEPAMLRVGGAYGCGTMYHAGTSEGGMCVDDKHFQADEV